MEELEIQYSVQEFNEIQGWLLLTFFICFHNQEVGSKNKWLLLSVTFTAKLEGKSTVK